jgi:hypothetical protein
MENNRIGRIVGFTVLAAAASVVLGALLVRDQLSRHRRELFSAQPLHRLAALTYLGRLPPSVDSVLLLRDFVAWERRPMIRKRAVSLLARIEQSLDRSPGSVPAAARAG